MKSDSGSEQKRKRVVNIVEIGDDGLVYIRLDDGKKYLLNGARAWDEEGFSWNLGSWELMSLTGEVTLSYKRTYTWLHTEAKWCYMTTPFWFDYKTCRVDFYVGS